MSIHAGGKAAKEGELTGKKRAQHVEFCHDGAHSPHVAGRVVVGGAQQHLQAKRGNGMRERRVAEGHA